MKVHHSVSLALAFSTVAATAHAQQPSPFCMPGTALCASSDGRGGVQIDARGQGQIGPNGATAAGQAGAQGNAQGNARAQSGVEASSGGGSRRRRSRYDGRFAVGAIGCPVFRAGVWSGFKAGGCAAVSFRWEALTFELETQLLYGGTTHAFDWTLPLSFVIPFANERSLFQTPYLRVGGSPVGVTFARKQDGGDFARFGLFAGVGYDMLLGESVAWRVFDVRASFDLGTKRAMDRVGHWIDLGAQLETGIIF